MNTKNRNRKVLAALIGSALAVGLGASTQALARPTQDQSARQDERDSRAQRRQAREDAAAERDGQPAERTERHPAPSPYQRDAREQQASEQQAAQQRTWRDQQAAQRDQQARIREQNEATRQRNDELQAARERAGREEAMAGRQRDRMDDRQDRREDRREDRRDDLVNARERQRDRVEDRQDRREDRQERMEDRQQARRDNLPPARRLDNRERDQRIVREKQQARDYQTQIRTQIAPAAKSYAEALRHSGRNHGYRYQQQYYWRLLQMLAAWNWSSYNYYNDPYFYTGNDYRYWRGGSWYYVNRYAADYLRQAINYGYQEGFWAGRADREDGWRYDYRSAFVYRDANYGYRGFYVSRSEYNYYFREGFRRGYEDGYYSRYRYGTYQNGTAAILSSVLGLILNFTNLD
jgi:hypothetical protein